MALIGTRCPSDWVSRFFRGCPFGERMLIHRIDLVEDRVSFWVFLSSHRVALGIHIIATSEHVDTTGSTA